MNDVERDLSDLGRRVEQRAVGRSAFPTRLEARVRRWQAATAATTVVVAVAMVGGSIFAIRWAAERVSVRPGGEVPIPGPTHASSPAPLVIRVEEGTEVGPSPIDPAPEDQWTPVTEPVFLGGERVFDAEWRLYAWRANDGFVGWYDVNQASGEHLVAGGSLVTQMPPCRLMQQIADLELKATPDVRRWLVYGYISKDVATVEIEFGGKTFEPRIFRIPDSLDAPFDMYAVAIDGFPVTYQSELALATRIRDADGRYLDPGDPKECLAVDRRSLNAE